jgi:hypothetical protein
MIIALFFIFEESISFDCLKSRNKKGGPKLRTNKKYNNIKCINYTNDNNTLI